MGHTLGYFQKILHISEGRMQIVNFTLHIRFEALTVVVVVKIQTSSDFMLCQLVKSY
jgi:hypothetical protein